MVGYRKIDDYKVELQTNGVDTVMPSLLNRFTIASADNFEKVGKDWQAYRKSPSGTGPWKMKAWTPRERAELERNTEYWNKDRIPKSERMVLLPIPDVSTRTAALLSGRVDWIEAPAPDSLEKLKAAAARSRPTPSRTCGPTRSRMLPGAPTADIRVRKAMNLAIDRDAIVKVLNGLAVPAVGCVPPDHPWFGTPSFKIKYDPAEAKKLLAEAGYGPGKKLKTKIAISTSGSGQMYPLIMNEAIQQQWAEVGIDVEFQVMDWNALLNFMRQGAKAPEAAPFGAINVSWNTMDPHNAFMRFIDSQQIPPKGSNWGYINDPGVRCARQGGAQHVGPEGTRQGAGQDQHQDGRRRGVRLGRPRRVAERDLVQGQGLRPPEELVRRLLAGDGRGDVLPDRGPPGPPHKS